MTLEIRQQRAGAAVVALHGSFDVNEAARLHQALLELSSSSSVTLDFRDVRLFHDSAIAVLARDLSLEAGPHVSLLGLSEHHYRLLHYIGRRPNEHDPQRPQ